MTTLVANFLKRIDNDKELEATVRFIIAEVLPPWSEHELGIGFKSIYNVVNTLTNASYKTWLDYFNKCGDIGTTVMMLLKEKRVVTPFVSPKPLTILEVYNTLINIAKIQGEEIKKRKEKALLSLYARASPLEAKYITKIILGERRQGFGEGLMEEAIAKAFEVPFDLVHRVNMLISDIGLTAIIAKRGKNALEKQSIILFHPIKPMLAEKAENLREPIREYGEAIFDYKLDGARVQIHKKGDKVKIFSRRLNDVTKSLPEVVTTILEKIKANEVIVEGEVIALSKEGKLLPFQYLMRRFRRIREVSSLKREIMVKVYLFDILYVDGRLLIDEPLYIRREILERIADKDIIIESIRTSDLETVRKFFEKAISEGHEGLVAKDPNSKYTPGIRGKKWLKIKASPYTLDLVIVAAEYGHGYRYKYLSDYHLAAYDPKTDQFLVVGKCFTGLTDDELEMMTKRLKEIAIRQVGRIVYVQPKIVVEVGFAEIQKSPHYPSGFALRFPRILRIRDDKAPREADTIDTIRKLYEEQQKKKQKIN